MESRQATRAGRGDPLWFLANLARVTVRGEDTGGAWSLVEFEGPRGDMPPLHVHTREEEAFYVLEGELSLFLGGERLRLSPGECAVAPRGVPHVYRVESERARWLVVCSPAGFEDFVAAVAEPAAEEALPPGPPRVDPERVAAAAAQAGIELLGPPGTLPSP